MPAKSKFRAPEAKTYQLLHRSLRDPLINDPEASDRILSEVVKSKGKARAIDNDLSANFAGLNIRHNEGEAAEYGIVYDDTEYDYMQHLRTTGASREAVFVEAPSRQKPRGRDRDAFTIPDEALPSHPDDEKSYTELTSQSDVPRGLQPDMNPRLREALEALEDEAFVDTRWVEDGEECDEFFDELVQGDQGTASHDAWDDRQTDLQAIKRGVGSDISSLSADEDGDTIGELQTSLAKRPPRAAASRASGYSMSSSSMFRSEGLQTLDDQFDTIEREYADSESEEGSSEHDGSDEAPDLYDFAQFDPTMKRGDLEEMMDDFLSRYEVLGGKLKPALEGMTPTAKLDRLRRELLGTREGTVSDELKAAEKARIVAMVDAMAHRQERHRDKSDYVPFESYEDKYDRWDCETVLSTYSNLENHPRLLSARGFVGAPEKRISLDAKTGMPLADAARPSRTFPNRDHDPKRDGVAVTPKRTIARAKDETPEARKQRKDQVKAERSERRQEKRATRANFSRERKRQQQQHVQQQSHAADVGGHVLGPTVIKFS